MPYETAEYLRAQARKIRIIAKSTLEPNTRRALIEMADEDDTKAAQLEAKHKQKPS